MIRKTFVPYKRSGLATRGTAKQKLDDVKLEFDLTNPKSDFVTLAGNGTDSFSHERAKNLDRVYGLAERWGHLVPSMYDTLRDSIHLRINARGEVLNRQTIEAQLQEEFITENYFGYRKEGAYLRSQYIQWIQQKCLTPLVRELTS